MQKGKQYLDLRGDFILTHNDALVKTRNKSAAPVKVNNADYTCVKSLNFVKRIVITVKVIAFIWGSNEALVPEKTDLNTPHVKEAPVDYPLIDKNKEKQADEILEKSEFNNDTTV